MRIETPRAGRPPRVNPFSTRFVRPGAIPYRVPDGVTVADLVRRLEASGGRGQVVGPHGSGKSTLLAALLPALAGWRVRPFRLSAEDRRLPVSAREPLRGRALLMIDGFEQLGFLTRLRIRRGGGGLLVSAHRSVGLPTLLRTDVTAESAAAVIARLVPPGGGWVLDGYDLSARLAAQRGSLRAVLFELYDRWEAGHGRRAGM